MPKSLVTQHAHCFASAFPLHVPRLQSTVLKQMKLIHHGGYNEAERDSYKEIIYSNTIQSMRCVYAVYKDAPKR